MRHSIRSAIFCTVFTGYLGGCGASNDAADVRSSWRDNLLAQQLYFPDMLFSGEDRADPHGKCKTSEQFRFSAVDRTVGRERIRYYVRTAEAAQMTLVFFHGNAGNACLYVPFFGSHSELTRQANIVLAEFPGYGGDGSDIDDEILSRNARALVADVRAGYGRQPVAVWGYSLGSGVATYAAATVGADALVLTAPYDSIHAVARELKPELAILLPLVGARHRYPAAKWGEGVRGKVFVSYSASDEVIPRKRSEALIAALRNAQVESSLITDGSNHSQVLFKASSLAKTVDFLKRTFKLGQ